MSSIGKRLLDLARSNLNLLLDRASDTADPRRKLSDVTDEELEAELARRREAREESARLDAAKATTAGAGAGLPKDRAERERIARDREAKVKRAREARERSEKAAREAREAEQRARASREARSRPGPTPGPGPGPSRTGKRDPILAKHYEVLEVAYGADWETVKHAYRKLMRKYHPDLHHKSPEKQRAATEVS